MWRQGRIEGKFEALPAAEGRRPQAACASRCTTSRLPGEVAGREPRGPQLACLCRGRGLLPWKENQNFLTGNVRLTPRLSSAGEAAEGGEELALGTAGTLAHV